VRGDATAFDEREADEQKQGREAVEAGVDGGEREGPVGNGSVQVGSFQDMERGGATAM